MSHDDLKYSGIKTLKNYIIYDNKKYYQKLKYSENIYTYYYLVNYVIVGEYKKVNNNNDIILLCHYNRYGKLHGEYAEYNNNKLIIKQNYNNGKLHGDFYINRNLNEYYLPHIANKILFSIRDFNINNLIIDYDTYNIIIKCKYNNNKIHGKFIIYMTNKVNTIEINTKLNNDICNSACIIKINDIIIKCNYLDNKLHNNYYLYKNKVLLNHLKFDNGLILSVISFVDKTLNNCVLDTGIITVYKLCKSLYTNEYVYVEILVPASAKRVSLVNNYKCRIEYGKVIKITSIYNKNCTYKEAISCVYKMKQEIYIIGQIIKSDKFDNNPNNICSYGIGCHKYEYLCDQWLPYKIL